YAEIVELDLRKLRGDLARRVEGERVRALEIGLRRGQLFGGRTGFGHPLGFLLDNGERIRRRLGTGGGAPEKKGRPLEPDKAAGYAVRKPAFLAYLFVKPRRETAAAQNMVHDIGGHELRIAARDAGPTERHHSLRDIDVDHDPAPKPAHRHVRDRLEIVL